MVAEVIQAYRDLRARSGRPIVDTANEHYQLRLLDAGLGQKRAESLTVADLVLYAQGRRAEDSKALKIRNGACSKRKAAANPE